MVADDESFGPLDLAYPMPFGENLFSSYYVSNGPLLLTWNNFNPNTDK